MKKITILFAFAGIVLTLMPSCKKEDSEKPPINETINANVNTNQSYSYTLPANTGSDAFVINTQSLHSSVSQIAKDASGNMVYNYTPASGFTGTDNVIISNENEEHHGNCGHHNCGNHGQCNHHGSGHHGKCDHHEGQSHIINIHLTVGGTVAH